MTDPQRNNPPDKPPPPPQGPPPNRFGRSLMGWVLIIGVVLLAFSLFGSTDKRRKISTSEFWTYVNNGQVTGKIIIREDRIEGENPEGTAGLAEGEPLNFTVQYRYSNDENFDEKLRAALARHNNPAVHEYKPPSWWEGLLPHLLLMVLVFGAIWFLLFRRVGQAGGSGFMGSFVRSKHRLASKEQSKVTFHDVAGIDEAKEEVREIIEFLKDPKRFQRLGGRIPRGILLVGEPGCGKTLLAKAIAGEADVPVFAISGSDFVELFVGVGASRVRDLFKQARESAPCIIFLDEIDAIGRRRGEASHMGGGQDEREQTLNAILVEMDGLGTSDQVIIVAATNRMDVLDPALTRPGRFDRQIDVPLPDLNGRYEILKIYADKVTISDQADLHRLARGTPMFSGADLEALVNEAAIAATMEGKAAVEQEDLEEARDKVRWGRARKSRVIDEKEKSITAYHEAGHVLVQVKAPNADPLHKVSIIPRGQMGGATFSLPEQDRYLHTYKYCQALLCIAFGERVAEEIFCGDISSGAANDIAQATEIAKRMVIDWGMSDRLGMVNYGGNSARRAMLGDLAAKDYSEHTAQLIDAEVKRLVDTAYDAARQIVQGNHGAVERIADALLKYETLEADEVKRIIDGETLVKTTVNDLLTAEQAKSRSAAPAEPDARPSPAEPPTEPPAMPEMG